MQNSSRLGCFGVLALCVAVYFLWIAVLYVGIPLALVGGALSYYLFKEHPEDCGYEDIRMGAAILAGGSFVIGVMSLVGNILTDQGPFGRPQHKASAPVAAAPVDHRPTFGLNEVARAEQNCSPPRSYASSNREDFRNCVRREGIEGYPNHRLSGR